MSIESIDYHLTLYLAGELRLLAVPHDQTAIGPLFSPITRCVYLNSHFLDLFNRSLLLRFHRWAYACSSLDFPTGVNAFSSPDSTTGAAAPSSLDFCMLLILYSLSAYSVPPPLLFLSVPSPLQPSMLLLYYFTNDGVIGLQFLHLIRTVIL